METTTAAALAAVAYWMRQRRLERPAGWRVRGGLWYPTLAEYRPCCEAVRLPSRGQTDSLLRHCRSVVHVAALYDAGLRETRRLARVLHAIEREALAREGEANATPH